jgi:hypothetical protein
MKSMSCETERKGGDFSVPRSAARGDIFLPAFIPSFLAVFPEHEHANAGITPVQVLRSLPPVAYY